MGAVGVWTRYALAATTPRAGAVERLTRRLRRVGLDGVLHDLDRTAERCAVPGEAAGEGFTWDELDREDPSWWPQGVASTRSGHVLLVSWYAERNRVGRTPGSRVSVVDRTGPGDPRYRHVLLVTPRRLLGGRGLRPVRVHAGGIAVRGDLLYVADTLFGLRIFRLGDVMRVPPPSRSGNLGRRLFAFIRPGAHGYEYVLPQLMAYRVPLRAGLRRLRFSFLFVGDVDGRANLVVGEYRRKAEVPPRLARYPLDERTGLPSVDDHARAAALEVYDEQPNRMQGVAVHGSRWFVTASAGEGVSGDLYAGAPGAWVRHRGVLPTGPEDLDWSSPGEELWCVSEWPGRRWVFPVATSRWQPSADPAAVPGS
jgi:hypothetical protein